jgi:hypothetical protein
MQSRLREGTVAESPPPSKILTQEVILQRGCPGAPARPARKQSIEMDRAYRDESNAYVSVRSNVMEPRELFPPKPTSCAPLLTQDKASSKHHGSDSQQTPAQTAESAK